MEPDGDLEREIDEEIRLHIERRTESNRAAGMDPEEARRDALRRFGDPEVVRRAGRRHLGGKGPSRRRWLDELLGDLRFATRGLARDPIVALVVVVSLAVGIAAATTVFAAADAFLFRSPSDAVEEPERLVSVFTSDDRGGLYSNSSFPDFRDVEEHVDAFQGVAAHRLAILRIERPDATRQVMGEIVSGDYFDLLGVDMALGRGFLPGETRVGQAEPVAVVSRRIWRDELGGDPDAVGRTLPLDGREFTVVGVAPEDLNSRVLALRTDVWVPVGIPGGVFRATEEELRDRGDRVHGVVARLREGATMERAQAQLDVLAGRLAEAHPEAWTDLHGRPRRLTVGDEAASRVPPDAFPALASVTGLVMLTTVLLLVVACSNVAGLLLARAESRRREIAVRLSMGASRGRLIRMLLVESLLMASLAAGVGLLLSRWMLAAVDSLTLPVGDVSLQFDLHLGLRTLLFAVGLATLTAVAFGLAPALQGTRLDLVSSLKGEASAGPGRGSRMRRLLVLTQVALAFIVGAGVAFRSFAELSTTDWGIDPRDMAIMSLQWNDDPGEEELVARYREVQRDLAARPEVETVTVGNAVEAASFLFGSSLDVEVDGRRGGPGGSPPTVYPYNAVAPGYLEVMGIDLLQGRGIEERDVAGASRVAVITEGLARRLWPDRDPLGRRFRVPDRATDAEPERALYRVVGVAADAPYGGLGSSGDAYVWTSLYQEPRDHVMLLARGRAGPEAVLRTFRSEILPRQEGFLLVTPRRLEGVIHFQFAFIDLLARLLTGAGAFGLGLAMIGLYGIVAYAVSSRHRELAVRRAVGADPRRVLLRVFSDGMRLAGWGLVLGLALVVPLTVLARSMIREVGSVEPLPVLVGAVLVLGATALASWIPARRAARIDPATVLRGE